MRTWKSVLKGLIALAFLAPAVAFSAAQDASPVTGALSDAIHLFINTQYEPHIDNTDELTLGFCDSHLTLLTPSHVYKGCVQPSRPLKLSGHKTAAVKIEPPIEGEWRFSGDYQLSFTPKHPWHAETDYTVDLQPGLFPPQVKLKSSTYHFTTRPLALMSKSLDYLQDPNDTTKKLVTARLTFNYPIDRASLEKSLSFAIEGNAKLQSYTIGYDDQDMTANVTVPVAALTKDAQFMNMTLVHEGVKTADGSATLKHREEYVFATGKDKLETNEWTARAMIPSLYDYLQITHVGANVVKDAHYVPQQMVVLETNAPIAAPDIKGSVEIHLLPKDKPVEGSSPKKDYVWTSPSEVTPDVRTSLQAVPFTVQAGSGEPSLVNALNFSAEGSTYLLVTVKRGLPAPGGYLLGKDYEQVVQVPDLPREIKIMAEGALLSLSGEKTLSVMSLGVNKLHYEIGRVKEEDISHLISQTRGDFAHPRFLEEYEFSENNVSRIFREDRTLAVADAKAPNFSSFNFSPYLKEGKGLFFLSIKSADDTKPETAQSNAASGKHRKHAGHHNSGGEVSTDRRFILLTDLGIIVKQAADGTRDVFVQSIAGGGPESSVDIQVLGLNGEPVAQVTTDSDGHATLPNLDGMKDEKRPVAFVARKGDDLSFLPYERNDRELNYSRFDVNGIRTTEGMHAYLFTDRGIYRPGETAHVGMIVKASDWTKTEAGLPLILEITNPHGQVVSKKVLHLTEEGLLSADYNPSETAATGVYNAELYLGRGEDEKGVSLGNVPLRIEEFQPDRMKMTSELKQDGQPVQGLAWVKPEALEANVTLMQLYGAPAKGRKVTAKMELAPGAFGFETYKDYTFSAEGSVTKTFDEALPETTTDADGKAHFKLDLEKYKASTFRLNFLAEGFEPDSGRSVKTAKSVLVSPLNYVLGVKQDGNLSYISPNDKRTLLLIAVDHALQKIAASDMTMELLRVKHIQSLTKDAHGSYDYQTTTVETSLKTEPVKVEAAGSTIELPTKDPGEYAYVFKNAGGAVLARVSFNVVGEGDVSGDFTRDATMQVVPDKQAYGAQETIKLNIQSPYTGTGLITIETDKVHAWKWFTTNKTSSIQSIEIPKGFEGKGFINVQFTRDLKSKEIFMSPLSFAVVPFTAGIDAHDQKVTLSVPKEAKPGDTVTVGYRTRAKGKIMVWAVDEGILQYAHYKNPDPLDYFLMRRALEVRTSQIMDLLLPEYSVLKSLSAIGGDGFANDGKNLNPFKRKTEPPVAYWSGILDSDASEHTWKFTVPSYFNGGVRVLAVSASQGAMGVSQEGLSVHGPLIVTPNLPLFAAPGDMFIATATVANHVKGSGKDAKVELAITPSEQLEILDAPKGPLTISEGDDLTVQIKLKATDALGSGSLKFNASFGAEHFATEQTLSIRPATPSFTSLVSGYTKETSAAVKQTRVLYQQLAKVEAAVSSLPVSLIGGLKDYLNNYPYGCTEQMTSQNFPNVTLYGNTELIKAFGWKMNEIESAIGRSFDQLRERQSGSGGWGMWNYYSAPHNFLSAYVMHFLLEAKEKNLAVPPDVFDTGMRYLKQVANEAPTSLEDAREKAYAIYVLTRAGEVTSNYIPHLTDYLESNYKDSWHDDLAAVYLAATYQLMQMKPEAAALLDNFHLAAPVRYSTSWHLYAFYDSLTKYSQYLYLIAKHFPQRLDTMDKAVVWRIANFVGEGSYNTLSSSYAVMAIDAYVTARKDALAGVAIHATSADGKEQSLDVTGEKLKVAEIKATVAALSFTSDSPGFFYQVTTSGYDKTLPTKPVEAGLELSRNYTDATGKAPKEVKLGDVLDVTLALRSGNDETVGNIAIVDLLPAGFELLPEGKDGETTAKKSADEADGDDTKKPDAAKDEPERLPIWSAEATDRREDRIVLYGAFSPTKESYHYRIRATSRGTFVVPPAYAQSMYDPALQVRGVAGSLTVQ